MAKLITIVGVTGNQGRAVVNALLGDPNYKLRGLTRNTQDSRAQELSSQGVEIVEADIDSITSLKSAFAGSYAVYGVTGFDLSKDLAVAEQIEAQQGKNIAQAAAETEGLQHFIWSTLPPTHTISGGAYRLCNFAGKNQVDDYIRADVSAGGLGFAAKTTFLTIGQYYSNYSLAPVSVHRVPKSGDDSLYVHYASHQPETLISWIGDVARNLAPFIKPILEQPEKTRGVTVFAEAETHTAEESLQIWAKAKGGVRIVTVPVSPELLREIFGKPADILGTMWRFWGDYGKESWSDPGRKVLTRKDLGVAGFVSLAETFKHYEL